MDRKGLKSSTLIMLGLHEAILLTKNSLTIFINRECKCCLDDTCLENIVGLQVQPSIIDTVNVERVSCIYFRYKLSNSFKVNTTRMHILTNFLFHIFNTIS